MSENVKLVIAKFTAVEGKGDALYAAIKRCVNPSRAENGCIHYDVFQSTDDPDTYLIHEKWKNEEAIQFHFEQEHFKKLIDDTNPLLASSPNILSVDVN